jgi:hypothetical protein
LEQLARADEEELAVLNEEIAELQRTLNPQPGGSVREEGGRFVGNTFGGREFMRGLQEDLAKKLNRASILEPRIASRRRRIGEIDAEIARLKALRL